VEGLVNSAPRVSIVIRAKNEAALIGETLEALFAQTVRDFEVILVDSGSTDGTLEIARRFPVRVIEIPPASFTFGRALNVGCAGARGALLGFLSGHTVPLTNRWMERMVSHFADAQIAGVWGGQTERRDRPPRPKLVRQDLAGFRARVSFGFSNANGMARTALWRAHPFDETLPGTEDKEWAHRVLQAGFQLVFDSQAYVYHYHAETLRQVWRRSHREHVGFARFLDLGRPSLGSIVRRTYWGLGEARRERAAGAASAGAMAEAARVVAQEIGRYTGIREGLAQGPLARARDEQAVPAAAGRRP
jgi:rhamnosyltransferase